MGCLHIHVSLKIQLCLKMWFSTFFDIMRYAEEVIYGKKFSFLSFYSFLVKFTEWHRGSGRVKLTKCDKVERGEQCHYASGILFEWPYYFIVILFYIWRKWLLVTNLAKILHLKSKLSGKFQCFNAIDGSIEMLKNDWITKHFN